ncbi:hypothetical protein [Streptomyces eurocidicus]|uniref:DUF4352 domain-containing protein n=1 Tax=Streptomyces eurocidicus TaxID=66423 RepID=A0A7W8F479_STREU|nr:hypothetical protein [Streptomyces eurocidicus]MBB5122568.1 hypothetical protein [Streptomyces eurocidicus]MBF6055276.1 hypothetical protein [Streptomyces eurocidicus]
MGLPPRVSAFVAATALTALTALTACGAPGEKAPAGQTLSPAAARTSAEGSRVVAFEDTFVYANGLKVKVTRPVAFTPSDTSLGHQPGHSPAAFTVTLTNATGKAFAVTGVLVRVKAGEQGVPARQVFDSARGVGNPFTGSLAPGESGTSSFAFDIPANAMSKVDVEVRPDFGGAYYAVHWVGRPG